MALLACILPAPRANVMDPNLIPISPEIPRRERVLAASCPWGSMGKVWGRRGLLECIIGMHRGVRAPRTRVDETSQREVVVNDINNLSGSAPTP